MERITNYMELSQNSTESLIDHISENAIENKEIVLEYLSKGEKKAIACHSLFDYVKKEPTRESVYLFTDGEFIWTSEDVYHFAKYNLEIKQDFINKVLRVSKMTEYKLTREEEIRLFDERCRCETEEPKTEEQRQKAMENKRKCEARFRERYGNMFQNRE